MMSLISTIFIASLLLTAHTSAVAVSRTTASSWESNPLLNGVPKDTLDRLRAVRARVEKDGCDVNVCFTIDGSGSISTKDFQAQLNFVNLVGNVISTDRQISFCGVQYSTLTTAISPLTSDRPLFFSRVGDSKQAGGGTNLAAALGYATSELFLKTDDTNKIIVLGDGLANIGFAPAFVATPFLALGGSISAIAVGKSSPSELAAVTGDSKKVFYIEGFNLLIQLVKEIIEQTCNLN